MTTNKPISSRLNVYSYQLRQNGNMMLFMKYSKTVSRESTKGDREIRKVGIHLLRSVISGGKTKSYETIHKEGFFL